MAQGTACCGQQQHSPCSPRHCSSWYNDVCVADGSGSGIRNAAQRMPQPKAGTWSPLMNASRSLVRVRVRVRTSYKCFPVLGSVFCLKGRMIPELLRRSQWRLENPNRNLNPNMAFPTEVGKPPVVKSDIIDHTRAVIDIQELKGVNVQSSMKIDDCPNSVML